MPITRPYWSNRQFDVTLHFPRFFVHVSTTHGAQLSVLWDILYLSPYTSLSMPITNGVVFPILLPGEREALGCITAILPPLLRLSPPLLLKAGSGNFSVTL